MKYFIVLILIPLCGCFDFVTRTYQPTTMPSEKMMSFESSRALASGATLQSITANKVYYEGTEPKSADAQILLDLSYRFLGLLGVSMNSIDPADPEAVKKVFEQADKALEEKEKIIYDLRAEVKKTTEDLASQKNLVMVKGKEVETWVSRFKKTVLGIIGFIVFITIVLFLIQIFTGIPVLTGVLGGIRTFFKISKQTVKGIQEVREKLKQQSESDEGAKHILDMIDATLNKYQDEHVKSAIKRMKQ